MRCAGVRGSQVPGHVHADLARDARRRRLGRRLAGGEMAGIGGRGATSARGAMRWVRRENGGGCGGAGWGLDGMRPYGLRIGLVVVVRVGVSMGCGRTP